MRRTAADSRVAVRWTIGDVSPAGFEALRLSVHGAYRIFGPDAEYVVCVNTVPLFYAQELTGALPGDVQWRDISGELPEFIAAHLDEGMAEGVGWKFAPLRLFEDRYELSLDNDCILWRLPAGIRQWLEEDSGRCVIAEDVRRMFGQFSEFCPAEPRNSGIRGLPPGRHFEMVLRNLLDRRGGMLSSELDEQGLQVAAVSRCGRPFVVTLDEASICSPFPPLQWNLGRCGAHFVGLNAHRLPWDYDGRPAVELIREHWQRHRAELYGRVGLGQPAERSPEPLSGSAGLRCRVR